MFQSGHFLVAILSLQAVLFCSTIPWALYLGITSVFIMVSPGFASHTPLGVDPVVSSEAESNSRFCMPFQTFLNTTLEQDWFHHGVKEIKIKLRDLRRDASIFEIQKVVMRKQIKTLQSDVRAIKVERDSLKIAAEQQAGAPSVWQKAAQVFHHCFQYQPLLPWCYNKIFIKTFGLLCQKDIRAQLFLRLSAMQVDVSLRCCYRHRGLYFGLLSCTVSWWFRAIH